MTTPVEGFGYDATLKPRFDMARFLEPMGIKQMKIPMMKNLNDEPQYANPDDPLKKVHSGDTIIYQLPSYLWDDYEDDFLKEVKDKGAQLIGVVHDVEFIRFPGTDDKRSLKLYKQMDILLISSQKLIDIIKKRGINTPMLVSNPWDYYVSGLISLLKDFKRTLNYAGNLDPNKATFIDEIKDVLIDVYGWADKDRKFSDNINYKGAVMPEELPSKLNHGFGLVWDGDIQQNGQNGYGSYLEYNWSHKFSLYLASGLPVIVWSKANTAKLVEKYQIGFTIDNLGELKGKLDQITKDQYSEYLTNIHPFHNRVVNGYYIQNDISRALDKLK